MACVLQVNVASLEEVVKYFLKLATERAEKAQAEAQAQWEASEEGKAAAEAAAAEAGEGDGEKKADKAVKGDAGKDELADVADLEAEKSPEDLMLSFVSGEKGKERVDRELVTPWFKFLWETYRTVLDILRNNSKLEALYAVRLCPCHSFAFVLHQPRRPDVPLMKAFSNASGLGAALLLLCICPTGVCIVRCADDGAPSIRLLPATQAHERVPAPV